MDRILPGMEPELSKTLEDILKSEGMRIIIKARVVNLSKHDGHGDVKVVTNYFWGRVEHR